MSCANENRQSNGQFGAGNPGGPGNPFVRKLAANRAAILNAVGPDEIDALMASLLERAMEGDMAAAKLVLQYGVGRPQVQKEPDLVDVDEFEVAKAKRVPHRDAVIALLDMPIEKAIDMAGQTPISAPYDPESARQDAEDEAAAQAQEEAANLDEARRMLAHMMRTGKWPADSVLGELEKSASREEVAEFRRMVSQALTEGKLPGEEPFEPFVDGRAPAAAAA